MPWPTSYGVKMLKKRGVSELLSTVLLLLLTITAGSVVYAFVSPMIRNSIAESQLCSAVEISVLSEGSTCYNSSSKEVLAEIGIGEKAVISGIVIQIFGENTGSATVRNATPALLVREPKINYNSNLITLPGQNEARTYILNSSAMNISYPASVKATPIVNISGKEKVCQVYGLGALNSC